MTRGCGILAVAAFASASTWPSSTPGRSSSGSGRSSAWGFVAPLPPPSAALPSCSSARAGLSWCGPRSAASSERRRPCAGGGRRTRNDSLRALRAAAFSSDNSAHSNLASGEGWGAGRARGEGAATDCNRSTARATLALTAAAGDTGDGGLGGLGLDPESVARAREAAKNDDYEWFMEFIGGDDEEDNSETSSSRGGGGGDRRTAGARSNTLDDGGEVEGSSSSARSSRGRNSIRGGAPPPKNSRRRAPNSTTGGRLGNPSREAPDIMDPNFGTGASSTTPRRRLPPTGRGFQAPPDGASGRRRGARPRAPADSAYDYDLDDEFDQEPGRGGWDYDPGLSKGIGERRRDVEVDKVRARTKPASMRMPLEEDLQAVVEGVAEDGEEQQPDLAAAAAADFEPVDSAKAGVLTEDLGYTQPEVSCMDPDMADLAIERRIRRPAAGMPKDWVAVGMPPPPPPPQPPRPPQATPAPAASSQTYFGEGATGAGGRGGGRGSGGVDGGALDLGAILGDGYDYDETNGGGGRQEGPRRTRPRPNPEDYQGGRRPRGDQQQQQQRRSPYYSEDDGYMDDDSRRGGYDDYDDGMGGRGGGDFYYDDDRAPSRAGRGRYEDDFAGVGGGGGGRRRRRKQRPQRKEPEMTAAERYERAIFGGLGGDDGGGSGGARGRQRLEEEEEGEEEGRDKIWTGVGPDGPWPTLEEFTKLLREETEVRLSLVGPWAAEVVSLENRFRLQAYEKWLEILEKGIGETLEEAGVFDASFTTDDDDDDDGYNDGYDDDRDPSSRRRRRRRPRGGGAETNNLYDSYTNYGGFAGDGGGGGGGSGGGYDPQGTRDERGLEYDGRLYGDDGDRRQRGQRPRGWDEDRGASRRKFDVGSFLRDGAQSIMQPAAGMEAKAAEFERRYPGRTNASNARGYDEDENGVNVTGRDRVSADDIGYSPQQPRGRQRVRRDGGDADGVEYRGGDRRDNPAAGYYRDEDEDEY